MAMEQVFMKQFLNWKNLFGCIIAVTGATSISKFFVRMYSRHYGETCTKSAGCLNEYSWFIALCEVFILLFLIYKHKHFVGFLMSVWKDLCGKEHVWNNKYSQEYPDPPRTVWDSIICVIYDSLCSSMLGAIPLMTSFFFLYYFLGEYIRSFLSFIRSQHLQQVSLSTLLFSNFELVMLTCLMCFSLVLYTDICVGITKLGFTQRHKFVMDQPTDSKEPQESYEIIRLSQALKSKSSYIRDLAYYDFKLLVEGEEERIFDLLQLSHPGLNPYTWTSILVPISNFIQDTTTQLKSFMATVGKPETPANPNDQIQKPKTKILFSTLTPSENLHYDNPEVATLRFRDLISPAERNAEFINNQTPTTVLTSPVKKLVQAPLNVVNSTVEATKKYMMNSYVKVYNFGFKADNTAELRNILLQYKVLIWASQCLTGVAEFSILNDANGVISTTVAKIINLHIQLYEVIEELIETLTPLSSYDEKIRHRELKILLQVLQEYKKSLVFFHVNYSAHVEVLRIPSHVTKQWNRICSNEISTGVPVISAIESQEYTLFSEL